MNKDLILGIDFFYKREYQKALFYFSLALKSDPDSKEARLGALLCDFAVDREDEAEALFEYYLVSKSSGVKGIEEVIEEITEIVENSTSSLENIILEDDIQSFINEENGIGYEDFVKLIENRGSFKEAFEDIMFSTKVLISKKEDFVDFLDRLIENGFAEMSMNYIEHAILFFPDDQKLISLIDKVKNIENKN